MKIYPNTNLEKNLFFKDYKDYTDFREQSLKNPDDFWEKMALENLHFFKNFKTPRIGNDFFDTKWFSGGTLNISYEAVDFWAKKNPSKIAIIFEGDDGKTTKITYKELQKNVSKSANLLKKIGVKKQDKVIFYMPQILETIYLMLAVLRIGAIHSIVFGGFSAESLKDRIEDLKADFIITADGGFRKGKPYLLKNTVDEALKKSNHKPKKNLIVKRNFQEINIFKNDMIYNDEIEKQTEICPIEEVESEQTSFILYTSGTTGKPKGIIHSTAGYALWAKLTTKWVFNLSENDIFFSTADIGWITGHSYTVYGPLLNGATIVIFEGNPTIPNPAKIYEIIEKHKVSKFYTAPTLIRVLKKNGEDIFKNIDLSSLRVLGSVGEPIDFESWNWYFDEIGGKNASISDTYWQTETGGHLLSAISFCSPMKPSSANISLPGIFAEIVDQNGNKIKKPKENGFLVITKPFPGMMRGIFGDEKAMKKNYFSMFREFYFTGDGAYYDEEGDIFITGRVDDIVNISGHKIGIAEVEDIVTKFEEIAECSIVGVPDEMTGEALFGFLVLKNGQNFEKNEFLQKINKTLRQEIGAIVALKDFVIVSDLPKTRSGKIIRRILRYFAKGKVFDGDLSTLENKEILEELKTIFGLK